MNPDSATFCYVYVLRSDRSKQWYVGYTKDLKKRFKVKAHNNGESTYTRTRGPYQLLYYEAYRDMSDARSREKQLKSGQGKAYLRKRLKHSLTLSR